MVTWEDAKLDTEFDGAPEDAPSTIILQCCGFLARKNRKEVVIAMDYDPASRAVRFTFAIPAKMVRKIVELEPQNAPKQQIISNRPDESGK